jgi:hypothetical protein
MPTVSTSVYIPDVEPRELIAGDQWVWNKIDLSQFPSADWALTYYLRGIGSFNIVATADPGGLIYNIVVPASATTGLAAGSYAYTAKVANTVPGTGEVYTVKQGDFQVLPNYATAGPGDLQANAEYMLEAVEAEIAARLGLAANGSEGGPASTQTSPGSAHEHISIAGREITKISMAELLKIRARYRTEVAMLENGGILPPVAWVMGMRKWYRPSPWFGP